MAFKQKVFIKTYGCQMNERDSETLKQLLIRAGFEIVDHEEMADVVFLNTCSVREMAESKALGKAGRLLKKKKQNPHYKVGILGCMAAHRKETLFKKLPELDFVVPPKALPLIPEILQASYRQDKKNHFIPAPEFFDFSCYEQAFKPHPVVAFVPIQQGCNMACSYCIVPHTRGHQQNRPWASILKEIEQVTHAGAQEVILLGQIVNTYRDKNSNRDFVDLLEAVQAIEAVQRIRFITPHPAFFQKRLLQAFKNLPKLCPDLHLPVQSGSDSILKAMRRAYTKQKILDIVSEIRDINPRISISTDIIVGYPGESEHDFQETVRLFETVRFDMAYIFKYSARPFTIAAPQDLSSVGVPESVKEERNKVLLKLLTECSLQYNEQFLNETQSVLIEGKAHRGTEKLFGKNIYNKKVIFSGPDTWIGSFKNVRIDRATSSSLEGKVVS